jgi:hypothetical protein
MEFFIRKGASDPILKMRMIDDGKNDKSSFNELLENAVITFEMFDVKTEQYQVVDAQCSLATRTEKFNNTTDEYYITYRLTESDTSVKGKYEGVFTVQFYDETSAPSHKLIMPIKEKLYINVI